MITSDAKQDIEKQILNVEGKDRLVSSSDQLPENTDSELNTQLKNSADMKNTDQTISAGWIAEVSHELRLPIANIKLLIETLLNGALEDGDTARKMLDRAQDEIKRLQSLVTDLLSVEQLSTTRYELPKDWLLFESRAKYAIDSTASMATEAKVNVKLAVAPGFRVFANEDQLDQILLNLLENAIKFTPPGGKVIVASRGKDGCFSVDDTGIGMAESEIPKIFQRFYRIDRSRSKGSTGLGLSIVKHILDSHGAKITVTSKEGQGSSFLLEFPDPYISYPSKLE